MIDIVKIIAELELSHDLHLARLLILLAEFGKHKNSIDGLSKLAKLDFLVRYPTLLEKALRTQNKSTKHFSIENYEKACIESAMVRYRFGPWDHRYRKFINLLIGKDLVSISIDGKKVAIMSTPLGIEVAALFAKHEEFSQYVNRSELVYKNFNYTGEYLTKFIYETFPEILTLKLNSKISI